MSTESAAGAGGLSGFMKSRMKSVAVAAALIAGTWFWIALPIEGMTPEGNRIFGALIAWVILLTAEVTDASIITLLWLVFLIIAGLAKPGVALSGFTDNTTWLLMGALMIGQACNSTGLARRVAFRFINLTGERYGTLTMCLLISGAILGLMMPSGTARAALYVPIYMGLCDVMKIEKGSRTALNLVMITIWSAAIGGGCMMWLTGSVLNPIMTSALVKFGVNQTWISYAVYSFPSAVVLMVLTWLTINFVAPPDSPTIGGGREMLRREYEKLGPMSPEERRTLIIVCACVLAQHPVHRREPCHQPDYGAGANRQMDHRQPGVPHSGTLPGIRFHRFCAGHVCALPYHPQAHSFRNGHRGAGRAAADRLGHRARL